MKRFGEKTRPNTRYERGGEMDATTHERRQGYVRRAIVRPIRETKRKQKIPSNPPVPGRTTIPTILCVFCPVIWWYEKHKVRGEK